MLGRLRLYVRHHCVGLLTLFGAFVLGASTPAEAVVGGAPAPPGRWPWMAALLDSSVRDAGWAQFCGGVVIGPRRVLTAGHCVIGERTRDLDVLVGRTRLTQREGRRLRVEAISVFPGFVNGRTRSLDAAVLTLAADAGVPPLALARPGQEAAWAAGTPGWTMGWGLLNARESPGGNRYFADRLRELQEPLQGDDACESVFGLGFREFPYRPASVLCAGTPGDHAGPCSGDSGGPLVVGGPDSWLDVGIDVAGDACGAPGYFDLYTRVDRISGFALGTAPTVQPDPVARPRVTGHLTAGARVRCVSGRWRGSHASFSVRWRRLNTRSHHIVGRHRSYRLSKRDVKTGVNCSVTAANRGGRVTVLARPLRPHAK
jgi:secreted trypsin-like serine protease